VALFVAALAIWFVIQVVDILLLVFIAILLAVYLSAVTDWLERRFKMVRWAGLTIAVVATVAAVGFIGVLLIPPVIDQTPAGRANTRCCGAPSSPTRRRGSSPGW